MCLAIPAQISQLPNDAGSFAEADILGVRRKINIELLRDDPPVLGDWVLIHVGFAMTKISAQQASEQLEMLSALGEAEMARDELLGNSPNTVD